MSFLQRFLGHPWVFDHIRPIVTGGIDMSRAYRRLGAGSDAVVLDIGCGTGNALTHLHAFARYVGVDTDPTAIRHARSRYGHRANVRFECRQSVIQDLLSNRVTHVCIVGLLHHLNDSEAIELLQMVRSCPTLVRAVSLDIVYLRGRWYNNLLARCDRGRFCRTQDEYEALVRAAELRVEDRYFTTCHPAHGLVEYAGMDMTL